MAGKRHNHNIEDPELLRFLIERPQIEMLARHGLRLRGVIVEADDDAGQVLEAVSKEVESSPVRSLQQRAALGDVVAGIAHQSRNIMSGVLSFVQVAAKRNDSERVGTLLTKIEGESRRCVGLLNQVLILARSRDAAIRSELHSCSMSTILPSATEMLESRFERAGIRFQLSETSVAPMILGDAQALRDVFVNLLQNAADALPGGGDLRLDMRLEGQRLVITMDDSGPGIPVDSRDAVFESSFTTKGAGRGTGLGLAVSRQVISEHGGTISVHDSPLGGARFVIDLPCAGEAA